MNLPSQKRESAGRRFVAATLAASALCLFELRPAAAAAPTDSSLTPITLSSQLVQVTSPPATPYPFLSTDATPFALVQERDDFSKGFRFRLLQALPERLWFNATVEASQRFDTNVYLSERDQKAGLVGRVTPNLIVGYSVLKNTSIYANYFALQDRLDERVSRGFPAMQSLSWGLRHNQQLTRRTALQLDLQARELWQTANISLFDFIPGVTLSHALTPNSMLFANAILQMRGRQYFVAPTEQLDPYCTVGCSYRHALWNLIGSSTLVTNFGNAPSTNAPANANAGVILDLEVNHPVKKHFPGLLAFARAEQCWNAPQRTTPSLGGSAFRLYTGLRVVMSKPSYYGAMDNLRKCILNSATNNESTNNEVTN